jgi:hypothetical protein
VSDIYEKIDEKADEIEYVVLSGIWKIIQGINFAALFLFIAAIIIGILGVFLFFIFWMIKFIWSLA